MRMPSFVTTLFAFASLIVPANAVPSAAAGSQEVLREKVRTIAVMPMLVAEEVPNADQVGARLENAIEARLAASGFTVIPAGVMRELQEKVRVGLGGYYDPRTGNVDKQRLETWNTHVESEYRRLHPADAWLYSRVAVLRAPVAGGRAVWHGVTESTIGEESVIKQVFSSPDVTGSLMALSLQVLLATPNGDGLYSMSAGLQLLEYFDADGSSVRFLPVAEDSILADPLREQRALSIALDPMLLTNEQRREVEASNKATWGQIKPVPKGQRPPKAPSVDSAAFLRTYRRIVVAPPDVPETTNRAAARERLATALTAGLQRAGFEVVPPASYAAVWDPIDAASGGFYDPLTGKLRLEKRDAAIREAIQKLATDSPVDAVFLSQVVLRPARLEKGEAKWDGASVELSGGTMGGLFGGSSGLGGTVPALSLEVRAIDKDLNEVFLGRGGIELLVRFKGGSLLEPGSFDERPESDWLDKPANDEKAVQRAIAPLLQRVESPK